MHADNHGHPSVVFSSRKILTFTFLYQEYTSSVSYPSAADVAMSSSNGTPPTDANRSDIPFSALHANSLDAGEKPRLTEEEKKQNHIASGKSHHPTQSWHPRVTCSSQKLEQKRRQAIREGFDRLCELVPGLEGMGRSEGIVLQRTVEFMRVQLQERRELIDRIESNGGHVGDDLKK